MHALLTFVFHTVPSVAPTNVSGGNGRRHELVISWEVRSCTTIVTIEKVTTTGYGLFRSSADKVQSGQFFSLLFNNVLSIVSVSVTGAD